MQDKQLFQSLLELPNGWGVIDIKVDHEKEEVDIYVEYELDKAVCPFSKQMCPIYDLRENRRWRHLDIMQYRTYINCRVPRIINKDQKVSTIEVPWSDFSERYTYLFEVAVIKLLQLCKNQSKTAWYFKVSYDIVNRIMKQSVQRGLRLREAEDALIHTIGLDEKAFLKGHQYVTVLTDIEGGRVLEIELYRTSQAARQLLTKNFTDKQLKKIKTVVTDMSDAYIGAAKKTVPWADHVVDRFHVMQLLNSAVDKTRKHELKNQRELLTNSRFALLKRPENLTDKQKMQFKAIDHANLLTAQVWRAKENFRALFNQPDKDHAFTALINWLGSVYNTTLHHLKNVARTIDKYLLPVGNALYKRTSNAITERLNGGIQELKSIAKGYRNYDNFRTAILFHYGKLKLLRPQYSQ
jgi:transposase